MDETFETIKQEIVGIRQQRRIHESIFNKATPWSPLKAYLLGQFKAGCNLQKKENGFQISSTNLQHLIKLQIWLRSNHKIYLNEKQKQKYINGSVIYTFHVRNQLMLSDLRALGFVATQDTSAKNNAPIPPDMPEKLLPHFLRGFLDERGHPALERMNQRRYRINYAVDSFLREVVDILEYLTEIRPRGAVRTIHRYGTKNSYYVLFNGEIQLRKIFNYLYHSDPIPLGLYSLSAYTKFCNVLGFDSDYENIDLELDMKSLYVLHAFCCERGVDPNIAINFNLPNFLNFCKARNTIFEDQEKIINEGKSVAANFCGIGGQVDWGSAFQNIVKIVGAKS